MEVITLLYRHNQVGELLQDKNDGKLFALLVTKQIGEVKLSATIEGDQEAPKL